MKKQKLNKKENFYVKGTLKFDDKTIEDVPCKIYLPKKKYNKPYMIFNPPLEYHDDIFYCNSKVMFKAEHNLNKICFQTNNISFYSAYSQPLGDIWESTIYGEPQDLEVKRYIPNFSEAVKPEIQFWVSSNNFLTPYNTRVKNKIIEFTIKNNTTLMFVEKSDSKKKSNGDLLQWTYLLACAKVDNEDNNLEKLKNDILPEIDNFLLIASFALRKQTVCYGWDFFDYEKNSWITYYRSSHTLNKNNIIDNAMVHLHGIVDFNNCDNFIANCYKNFSCFDFDKKKAVHKAINAVILSDSFSSEARFLNLFSALEGLILDFRRQNNLEFILDEKEFSKFKKILANGIDKCSELNISPDNKKLIKNKLLELNRISLKDVFNRFCKEYKINLSDLWMVFGSNKNKGLNDIRNKLAHGEPFPKDLIKALDIANFHLRCTLERMLIRILGWNIDETSSGSTHQIDFNLAQEQLSEYVSK